MKFFVLFLLLLTLSIPGLAADWQKQLEKDLETLDREFPGDLSVVVRDVDSGQTVSLRAQDHWYLASTVKLPIAVALLHRVDQGDISLDEEVELFYSDYVDGAGQTNWQPAGTRFTLEQLYQEMLQVSDNTATDMIIRTLGIDSINHYLQSLQLGEIGPITTLADVRRLVYGEFDPASKEFTSEEFFRLKKTDTLEERLDVLADIFGKPISQLGQPSLDAAFEAYYASAYNSSNMQTISQLLEQLVTGQLLSPESTDYLLETLKQVKTGDKRIKAGLPEQTAFAHKTGTQHRRACNLGVAWKTGSRNDQEGAVIIAACTRGPQDLSQSEAALKAVGDAVTDTGLLGALEKPLRGDI
ncbi:serine hydrolase [Marinospirillum sp.]|uniref:serine hydrolase n=1 Tax=Marinospirillum sp. TaxID=2183934 RepID=UPI00286FBCAF|nr:serine hydrolase [Marinospirillum sp.]MDR9469239.1 serine hydrolase [Marinospirillum sp.]